MDAFVVRVSVAPVRGAPTRDRGGRRRRRGAQAAGAATAQAPGGRRVVPAAARREARRQAGGGEPRAARRWGQSRRQHPAAPQAAAGGSGSGAAGHCSEPGLDGRTGLTTCSLCGVQVGVRFSSGSGSDADEEWHSGGDTAHSDRRDRQEHKSCCCESESLATAIGDLSRQLCEMSSALMGKMSSMESRLGRLENQLQGIQAAVEDQRAEAESNSSRSSTAANYPIIRDDGSSADRNDTRRNLSAEPPCAWPPQPSVFERY
ncbi:unnamed protein product [Phytophthora fragariaefolia]|uniref:Unnamed protein product n=1 Tax=Phytophthora fragariaefolia TaxID=1490495 RepID=A0A9W6YNE8_9STRA|nr:unnamed protein product [Phytophthora fragariaefolia]